MSLRPHLIEESLAEIWNKSKSVDLSKVGLLATTEVLAFFHDKESKYSKFVDTLKALALTFAMNRPSAIQNEGAYVIRDLSPMEDLLYNGEKIKHNQWFQSDYRIGKNDDGEYFANTYSTSLETKNNDKTIMIYGLELLNPFKNTFAQRIEFWRSTVKLITWFDVGNFAKMSPINYQKFKTEPDLKDYDGKKEIKLNGEGCLLAESPLYLNPTFFFTTPILYKENDLMNVRVNFGTKEKMKNWGVDEIKLKGFVVEPIGLTCIG